MHPTDSVGLIRSSSFVMVCENVTKKGEQAMHPTWDGAKRVNNQSWLK